MNKLNGILVLVSFVMVACGGGGGGSGSGSSSSIVPMINDINCSGGPCASSSFAKSDANTVLGYGVEFYDSVNEEIIPEMKATMKEMDVVLSLADIDTCDSIPSNGETTVTYQGAEIKIVALPPTSNTANLFGQSTATTKAIKAYNDSDQQFFHAEFNCSSPKAGFIHADYTILNPADNNKFIISFLEDGSEKKLALFTEYLNADTLKEESYMAVFSTSGTDFEGHFGFSSDTSVSGDAILAFNKDNNGTRAIAGLGMSSLNFVNESDADVAEGTSGSDSHYCYSPSLSSEACGTHPSINILDGNDNAEGLFQATGGGTLFTLNKLTTLDFSF